MSLNLRVHITNRKIGLRALIDVLFETKNKSALMGFSSTEVSGFGRLTI